VRDCAEQLSRGTSHALDRLFDLTGARLVRYACTITRHRDDAEDAFQAALVRVARRPENLARSDNPWAYFLRIVRNESLRILQHRRPLPLPDVVLTSEGGQFAELEAADVQRSIQTALAKLPPSQAEVVVLKVWEEMTFAEIAEVLEESPNTVASRYRYALQKLSGLLEPLSGEVPYGS
jgi:RNA polymerase sigma-70 factor (ECF subfamily)